MKSILNGFLVAFSLYSAIPVPQVQWQKSTMRWALSFLPLIGIIIGVIEWFWYVFCSSFDASPVLYSIISVIIPLIISGGIHLDGFCDTCDALCSFGDLEKKLAILKDPHVGAFGPMWLMAFLLCEVAFFAQLYKTPKFLIVALLGFAIARACGGSKIVAVPCAKNSGLAHIFSQNSDKKIVLYTLILQAVVFFVIAGLLVYNISFGITTVEICFFVIFAWYFIHNMICKRIFSGITGDLAGFFISTSELIFIAVCAVGGMVL